MNDASRRTASGSLLKTTPAKKPPMAVENPRRLAVDAMIRLTPRTNSVVPSQLWNREDPPLIFEESHGDADTQVSDERGDRNAVQE